MRILLLANKGSNHAKKCAEGLAARGHEVFFVSPNDALDGSVKLHPDIKLITLKYGGKKGYILNFIELRKVFRMVKPDVVNVHYASGCGLLALLSGLHPQVLSCYGSDIFEFPHLSKLNNFLLCRVLNNADALASTSHAMAEEVWKLLGYNTKPIAITPFGVDVQRFCPVLDKAVNPRPVIGIVKSLLPIYDIPLLIKAFAIVHASAEIKPVLKIYGNGPLRSELEQMVSDMKLGDSVHFLGSIPNSDVPDVLNKMDIFVNCSKQESFGVNILEAMSCELPVIATDCVGPRELIEDGVSGIIVKDRKPESMAAKIIELLQNKELRIKLGNEGRKRVLECYNWEKNVEELESLLSRNRLKN